MKIGATSPSNAFGLVVRVRNWQDEILNSESLVMLYLILSSSLVCSTDFMRPRLRAPSDASQRYIMRVAPAGAELLRIHDYVLTCPSFTS